ncbi:MAG: prepilin-type N-terminal cleavage/methylation domain-containing protein [Acidobacteria bacterium]|nr:prepilin-type N-terminal cleavage/methylation domain-containing protein [Acidobacteriota bacterium]
MNKREVTSSAAGFSLAELMIALTITLILTAAASALLAGSFNVRGREDQKSSALADSQRALNLMSREIANSGFGLTSNGIVAADSGASSIRVRANLNAFDGQLSSSTVSDASEDVRYRLVTTSTASYIERLDVNTLARTTVLANRVDSFLIRYFADKVDYTPGNCDINTNSAEVTDRTKAKYLVFIICVQLPARGTPKTPGYQPVSSVQLASDVTLRNATLTKY